MGSEAGSNSVNISQEFLAKALGPDYDILQYTVRSGSKPGDNYASVIYSADVEAKNKEGKNVTKHLLLKCYPIHPTRQEFTNKTNMFFKEMEIYRLWMPELRRFQTEVVGLKEAIKLPYAPFVYGKCIDFASVKANEYDGKLIDPLDNCIIMEDLREAGFRMTNRREPMDIDHLRLVVYELAKVHSISWAYKSRVEKDVCRKFPCLVSNLMIEQKEMWMMMMESGLKQAIETIASLKGPEHELTKALKGFQNVAGSVHDAFSGFKSEDSLNSLLKVPNNGRVGKEAPNPVPWRVISHGDCWSNNMLFKYDEVTQKPKEVVLVDLQLAKEACVIPDLVNVIYLSTDSELRKNHLADLMKLYVDSFNGFCKTWGVETLPGFNLESFKYRFHRFKLLGLFMASMGLSIILKEEDNAEAMDLENMDKSKEFAEMFTEVGKTSASNSVYNERLLGIVQEMYDDGLI